MIRTIVKLDDATIDALKMLTEKEQELRDAFQQAACEAYIAYHRRESLLFPRFPISHPYKGGRWRLPE